MAAIPTPTLGQLCLFTRRGANAYCKIIRIKKSLGTFHAFDIEELATKTVHKGVFKHELNLFVLQEMAEEDDNICLEAALSQEAVEQNSQENVHEISEETVIQASAPVKSRYPLQPIANNKAWHSQNSCPHTSHTVSHTVNTLDQSHGKHRPKSLEFNRPSLTNTNLFTLAENHKFGAETNTDQSHEKNRMKKFNFKRRPTNTNLSTMPESHQFGAETNNDNPKNVPQIPSSQQSADTGTMDFSLGMLDSIVEKAPPKTSRFVDVNKDQFIEDEANINTKRKTNCHIKLFTSFLNEKSITSDIDKIDLKQLDDLVGTFIIAVRKANGEEYEPEYLRGIINSINRHLRSKKINASLTNASQFPEIDKALKAKCKNLKKKGKGNKAYQSDPLTEQEIKILYEKELLSNTTPHAIINAMWWNFTTHFGLRAVKEHYQLKWGDVTLCQDQNSNLKYLKYGTERQTKTRTGENHNNFSRADKPIIVEEPSSGMKCPIAVYETYASKRPQDWNSPDKPFYLAPITDFHNGTTWFKRMIIGEKSIGQILPKMIVKAGLNTEGNRKLTNTSGRKYMVSKLMDAGVPETEIIHITGHKDTRSLKSYNRVSLPHKMELSNLLHDGPSTSSTIGMNMTPGKQSVSGTLAQTAT